MPLHSENCAVPPPILWELTDEDGKAIWKINLIYNNQKRELKIDALNKNII